MGRKTFENESFEEGIWKNGGLQNLGIKYDFGTNEYKLCSFFENKLLKEYKAGENIPINLLSILNHFT